MVSDRMKSLQGGDTGGIRIICYAEFKTCSINPVTGIFKEMHCKCQVNGESVEEHLSNSGPLKREKYNANTKMVQAV